MDNRDRLLDCALQLFSQQGYAGVSVQEVVQEAGVTKPTLYHYFKSKRGLLETMLAREAGNLLAAVLHAAAYHGDLVLTLEQIVRTYFMFAKQQMTFYRLYLAMCFAPPESESNQVIRPYMMEEQEILENIFIQAVPEHGNLRGKYRWYAVGLRGTINAIIGLSLKDQLTLNEDLVYQTVHQFMHGILN